MMPSQWLDILIVAIAFVAAVSGWRSGALGSLMALVGVALGAVAGVLLAPHIIEQFDGQRTRLFVALFLILALVVVGEIAGVVLGRAVRGAVRSSGLRFVDSVIGVAVQLVVVLVAVWMLATPLGSSEQPKLAAAVDGSKVIGAVDDHAPGWLRMVPDKLSGLMDTSGLPIGPSTPAAVDPPDPTLADSPVVALTQPSVVKIVGEAPGCRKMLEGTGFVVAPNRVMSNAHVVAGAERVTVNSMGTEYEATVISYDPNADISLLYVPELQATPLDFIEGEAREGTDALVLGYPGGGEFTATPARVREVITLNGPDIYRTTSINRKVYTIRGPVHQGNSGGPLINRSGQVLGVVFGAAVDDEDTGFVLTGEEVSRQFARINETAPVQTGACVG